VSQPVVDPAIVDKLVAILCDERNTEPAATFPRDSAGVKQPGLYAWWTDEEGREILSATLEAPSLPALIYAGLAGATHWPSGKASTTTLWSRVRGLHLRGNIRGSTFRQTLAAVLVQTLGLQVIGPNRLNQEGEEQLSAWMAEHLRVIAQPYSDRDKLGAMETAILARLAPPLNLNGMEPSLVRSRVTEHRRRLAHPS